MKEILRIPLYILSLPERLIRASAAGLGGLIFEIFQVLLPEWLRRTHLYRAIVARILWITIEWVGGVRGTFPGEGEAGRGILFRKVAGNVVEYTSFLALGWSPIWVFAATADLTGGTRIYLQTLVDQLKKEKLLANNADVQTIDDLLNSLERTSGHLAASVDLPPLNIEEMRTSLNTIKANVAELPERERISRIFETLNQLSRKEGHSLRELSSVLAVGATKAGVQLGHTYIFDYYQEALENIGEEGLDAYVMRVSLPYRDAIAFHFHPNHQTKTEEWLLKTRN